MSTRKTLANVFTVGAFTMLSRVLGLVREMLQSRLIGAGMEQAAFTLAFAYLLNRRLNYYINTWAAFSLLQVQIQVDF